MLFKRRTRSQPQRKSQLKIAGLSISVTRKTMKYMRLKVSPPHGEVSLSAPHSASNRELQQLVEERLLWIKQQQDEIRSRSIAKEPTYQPGDTFPLWGQTLTLTFTDDAGPVRVQQREQQLLVSGNSPASVDTTACALDTFYRTQLREKIPALANHWQPIVGRNASFWGIKRMKTRWGSCNTQRARIWLNLELVKYPPRCLEYVIVHELVHLQERYHNQRFYTLLSAVMPDWETWHRFLNHR